MAAFPSDAIATIVKLFQEGIASGNLVSHLLQNWQVLAESAIAIISWFLAPSPVGAVAGTPQGDLQYQISQLALECPCPDCDDEECDKVKAMAVGGILPWPSIIIWLIQWLLSLKKEVN